jgi:hypothetical protein
MEAICETKIYWELGVETMMKMSRNRQKRLARVLLLLPFLSIAVAYLALL